MQSGYRFYSKIPLGKENFTFYERQKNLYELHNSRKIKDYNGFELTLEKSGGRLTYQLLINKNGIHLH